MTIATDPPASVQQPKAEKKTPKPYNTSPGRLHFAIRRVHSAMGLLFGGYICVHLLVNSTGLWPRVYQQNVDHIHSLSPMLPLIELTAIFIPLLLHALYGIYITWAGVKFNTMKYNYGGNLRYTLQRWTAVLLLAFIAFHIGTLHKWGLAGVHNVIEAVHPMPSQLPTIAAGERAGELDTSKLDVLQRFSFWCSDVGGLFQDRNRAFQTTRDGMRNMFSDPNDQEHKNFGVANGLVVGFYLLGILSAVFHFANGLWTSAIAWGLTVTATAQKRWGHVCFGLAIVLGIIGVTAWYAFTLAPWAQPLTEKQSIQLDLETHTQSDDDMAANDASATPAGVAPATGMLPSATPAKP